ncbi:MAG TPA: LacI family DNA-binding transcriptional regulator [Steroidobacteraceae bacterium]|nr:LacI family DNA-binding transcriptional regulator [Steroidobacteraceae bacterium]
MNDRSSVPKIEDVAERAGVSASTVSRFYNNPAVVAPSTAKRIREAIAATGYVPDLLAGGLASRRSRLVAVLVPEISHSIFNDTIEAMANQLSLDGYIVMLGLTGADNSGMKRLIEAALARRAEAVILSGIVSDNPTRELLRSRSATVIETWGLPEKPIDVAVGFSHAAIGEGLARFLAGRGYRRPHLIVGDGERARMRRDSFVRTWRTLGRGKPTEMKIAIPTHFGHARLVWRHLVELDPQPDVAVCGSDLLAQGLIIEAQAAGKRIPEDLAVVGFGHHSLAGEMRPTITSVDVDGARIGREAVAVLKRRAAGETINERVIDVGFRIIARESA